MKTQKTQKTHSETRDETISGLLRLAQDYSDAGDEREVGILMAACQMLRQARDDEEDGE